MLEQLGMFIVMGVVIWWLSKRLIKVEGEKEKLSQDVIKLTTLWETKANKIGEEGKETLKEILNLLNEIKGLLK